MVKNGCKMSSSAITKIQTIFITAIMIVAAVAGASWYYLSTSTSQNRVKLTFWSMDTDTASMNSFNTIARSFEASYPVNITVVPVDWGVAQTKVLAAVQAGNPPDVSVAGMGWALLYMKMGALVDLDQVVQDIGGTSQFLSPSMLYENQWNGHMWGITYVSYPNILLYRKDWLATKNLTVPTTWAEFENVCQALTGNGRYAYAQPVADMNGHKAIWCWMMTDNATIFDKDNNVAFDTARTVETFDWLSNIMKNYSPPGIASYGFSEDDLAFKNGQVGIIWGYGEMLTDYAKNFPNLMPNVGVMDFPMKTQLGGQIGNENLVAFNTSDPERIKYSRMFIEFILKPENIVGTYLKNGVLEAAFPSLKSLSTSSEYSTLTAASPWNSTINYIATQIMPHETTMSMAFQGNLYAGQIEGNGILQKVMEHILVDDWTAQKAVTDGQDIFKTLVASG